MEQIAYQDIQPALVGKIKIRLSSNELKLIDNIRGLITRSKYVQKAVERFIENARLTD